MTRTVHIGDITIGTQAPFTIIAGPCVIESESMILQTAEALATTCQKLGIQFIFKSSYKKANRTSLKGFTGLPFDDALAILEKVRRELQLPVLTDVHTELEVPIVAEVADVLQIPAFLCRQTDLLIAAGRTGRAVNIKKGQFLAPQDMQHAADKVASTGNQNILLTERGATFGYNNLVVDMRSLVIMTKTGYPVVYDATHSVQLPGGAGGASAGQPEFIPPLARAAIATGVPAAVFMEVHPDPPRALSDAQTQWPLVQFESIAQELKTLYDFIHSR